MYPSHHCASEQAMQDTHQMPRNSLQANFSIHNERWQSHALGDLSMEVRWEFGRQGDKRHGAEPVQIHRAAVGIDKVLGSLFYL